MKLPTAEMGYIHVLAVWERDGAWEDEWEPLRGTVVGDQFSSCSQEALDHALHGLSRPLVDSLGIPPAGALQKLPDAASECERRRPCPLYDQRLCTLPAPTLKRRYKPLPFCFEPEGIGDEHVRQTATKAIELWRQGVYLLIVKETTCV